VYIMYGMEPSIKFFKTKETKMKEMIDTIKNNHLIKLKKAVVVKLLVNTFLLTVACDAQTPCQKNVEDCSQLLVKKEHQMIMIKKVLEPSGLIWAKDLGVAIGVDDERKERPTYEIFAFNLSSKGEVEVIPLLSDDQSKKMKLDDLEGLTRTPDGTFYAITSLSLDVDDNSTEDRWTRFQAVRFNIEKQDDGKLKVTNLKRLSKNKRPDLREWFISSSEMCWPGYSYKERAEKGGINVEGLASTSDGKLLVGFRGPLVDGRKTLIAELAPPGINDAPGPVTWRQIDVTNVPTKGASMERGIRAIERIPNEEFKYVVILGHTGALYDRLHVGIWDAKKGKYSERFELPSKFVGEGIAVISSTKDKLQLLLVSDLNGYFMKLEIDR
jgi:hypothetical protein